jgi:predicted DCC family thiol-disulfide oxidoreductase YuxK
MHRRPVMDETPRTAERVLMIDAIVFFDGDCAFCQKSIVRILRWDVRHNICVASLTSLCARDVLDAHAASLRNVDSLVLWHRGHVYVRARALRRIGRLLGGVWSVLAVVSYAVPFLDAVYDVIAKRRYLLHRTPLCVLPQQSWQSRWMTDDHWATIRKDVWNEII